MKKYRQGTHRHGPVCCPPRSRHGKCGLCLECTHRGSWRSWRPQRLKWLRSFLLSRSFWFRIIIVLSFSILLITKNVANLLSSFTVLNFHPVSLIFIKLQKPPIGFVNDVDNAHRNIGLQMIGVHVPGVFSTLSILLLARLSPIFILACGVC